MKINNGVVLERHNGGGASVLTVLLLLVLKTVGKVKIIFFRSKGGGAMALIAPSWLHPCLLKHIRVFYLYS